MIKVMLVFGTRPEAIKMVPLVKTFQKYPERFQTFVCVTGQHREMLDQVLALFQIQPDFDLNIMQPGQDLYDVTSKVLMGLRDVLSTVSPDLVLVHGDTTTSTAAALAAYYKQIPVGHIEAGLRTYDVYSPFPEEMNRQLTSRIAAYHFAPTLFSKDCLLKENIDANRIYVTGNTVIDTLHMALAMLKNDPAIREKIEALIGEEVMARVKENRRLVLITGHRRENFGDGFIQICKAIRILAERYPSYDFVYPVHLNPNVQKPVYEWLGHLTNVHLLPPLDYLPFVYLMEKSYLILTDSGGIQEEAPGIGKPVLVMRETTERPEAVKAGTVRLVGAVTEKMVTEFSRLVENAELYNRMSEAVNPYGDGHASERIVEAVSKIFNRDC